MTMLCLYVTLARLIEYVKVSEEQFVKLIQPLSMSDIKLLSTVLQSVMLEGSD